MVLVSLVLVVLAAVTLVIGLLQSGVTIIYISIACSLVAGIVLFVAVRRGRPEAVPAGAGAPGGTAWTPPQQQGAPAAAPAPQPSAEPVPAAVGAPARAETATTWAPDSTQQLDRVEAEPYEADEPEPVAADGEFPIPDYDRLRATDIMPLLVDLDADQLQQVRAHEESRKHRFTVLRRIDDELAAREVAEEPAGWEVSEEEWQGAAAGQDEELAAEPVAVEEIEEIEVVEEEEPVFVEDEEEVEEFEPEPEPEPEPAYAAPRAGGFPIPDYDQLMMLEVLPRLVRLDADELLMVRQHEEAGLSRSTILNRIDKLLQQKGPAAERYAEPEPALTRSRAGRSRAPKAAAGKASARKAAAGKRSPAKRSGIKQAAAKTPAAKAPAAKRAVAVKRTAKKAAVKKAAVKKAPGRRAAAKTLGTVKKTAARKAR